MQKTSLTLGLILTLALAVVIDAQQRGGGRGGFDAAAIATALPLEGAPPALPGPYKVEGGPAFNSPGHVVYRPVDLTPFGLENRNEIFVATEEPHGVIEATLVR